MPRVTAVTSAPTFSHRSETMLMKDILVERKALAACLINSAVLVSVTTMGRPRGRVEVGQDLARALGIHPAHDAVRMEEILDGPAFAEEFGIGGDIEIQAAPGRPAGGCLACARDDFPGCSAQSFASATAR